MKTYLAFLQSALAESPDSRLPVRSLAIMLYVSEQRFPVLSRNVAQELRLPKPTLSRLGKQLQKIGLIEKNRGKKDARDCWLTPTEKGRAFVAAITSDAALSA